MAEGKTIDASEVRLCVGCGRGVMHDANIIFYRITMETCCVDLAGMRQVHAMEMLMGGNTAIAHALSPTTTIGSVVGADSHWLCMECVVTENIGLARILEAATHG